MKIGCSVIANPPASITWFKKTSERVRTLISNSKISITRLTTITPNGPISSSILTVRNVERNDNGDYICEARNNDSSSESISFNFTVMSKFKLAYSGACEMDDKEYLMFYLQPKMNV